jgi:carbamoyl-phosphate synthase large subunit
MGMDLLEIKNPVTNCTYAFFEPAMDYIALKVPRWDLVKFRGASRLLGSTMKSVGEVMAIGRSFAETLQKSIRMVLEDSVGLSVSAAVYLSQEHLEKDLREPTDKRLFAVIHALRQGFPIDRLYEITSIDKWFLAKLREIVDCETEISNYFAKSENLQASVAKLQEPELRHWKQYGFGDEQIATLALRANGNEDCEDSAKKAELAMAVRKHRLSMDIKPCIKKIDTTAGEYPAVSNYLYFTYIGTFNDELPKDTRPAAIVLGSGAYRVGTSVEFDWCGVSCSKRLQELQWRSIILNFNPETVSTDYNSSDRLYFDELTLERILDIADFEKPEGVIASMGGQLPNRLARSIAGSGLRLLGHSAATIDFAEDRNKFSSLLDQLKIEQPRWLSARNAEELEEFVDTVGFPILVRPSYVLSGAAMSVAFNYETLKKALSYATEVSAEHPVVVSEFIQGAREIELDGVAQNGEVLTAIVSEHVENAGVHSGDATLVVPAQKLYVETVRRVRRAARAIVAELKLNGPFNIQFMARSNQIQVIECNARASRSFPFVSKVAGINLASISTDVMVGKQTHVPRISEDDLPHVGVKAAMFSFPRLAGVDPILGVEMASTGEVGCIAPNFDEALLLALESARCPRPKKGVLVSAGPEHEKLKFLGTAKTFIAMGLPIYATAGTALYLRERGFPVKSLAWPGEGQDDVIQCIRSGLVDLVINIPKNMERQELTYGSQIRKAAISFGCTLLTNIEKAIAFSQALQRYPDFVKSHQVQPLPRFSVT